MHTIEFSTTDKTERYRELLPQLAALLAGETDLTANLANTAAVLKAAFGWLWVGFYRVDTATQQLVLGPFQGPLACTRIDFGRGVCGQAWAQAHTVVVPDVHRHPDHIACSSLSQSEIVVPVFNAGGQVILVLDADAEHTGCFDHIDAEYLTQVAALISRHHPSAP